jgi:hypothetical protein
MMLFGAPWDRMLKIVTSAIVVFLCLETIIVSVVMFLSTRLATALPITILICICNALILLLPYLYAPRGFIIDETGITVVRALAPVHIEREKIQSVSRIGRNGFMKSIRTFGSGGLFGYYGSFRNRKLGHFKMYATHGDCGILVTAHKKYILTPDRPDEFVQLATSYLSKS